MLSGLFLAPSPDNLSVLISYQLTRLRVFFRVVLGALWAADVRDVRTLLVKTKVGAHLFFSFSPNFSSCKQPLYLQTIFYIWSFLDPLLAKSTLRGSCLMLVIKAYALTLAQFLDSLKCIFLAFSRDLKRSRRFNVHKSRNVFISFLRLSVLCIVVCESWEHMMRQWLCR